MTAELTFLGTGASSGVPLIGCHCPVCQSTDPHNKRLRPSALIKVRDKHFIIDVGPDFRTQALTYKIERLDGVLITHTHYDHIGGVDDLRAFFFLQKKRLPCLLSKESFEELKIRLHYLMQPKKDGHSICAQIDFFVLDRDFGQITFEGETWRYMSYFQSGMKVNGLRLGKMAYVSDIREYKEEVFEALKGVEVLVLSALRHGESTMHFNLEEAIQFSEKVAAKKTWITHISHELDHKETNQKLPHNVQLSYDGLKITFDSHG